MPLHPLARLAACFAIGLLIAAVALVAIDRVVPIEPAIKVGWLWLGGNVAILTATILPMLLARSR